MCDENIDVKELEQAIKEIGSNKIPGSDSLTLEFFLTFFFPQFKNVLSSLEIKRKNIVTFYENGYLYCNKKEGDKRFLNT